MSVSGQGELARVVRRSPLGPAVHLCAGRDRRINLAPCTCGQGAAPPNQAGTGLTQWPRACGRSHWTMRVGGQRPRTRVGHTGRVNGARVSGGTRVRVGGRVGRPLGGPRASDGTARTKLWPPAGCDPQEGQKRVLKDLVLETLPGVVVDLQLSVVLCAGEEESTAFGTDQVVVSGGCPAPGGDHRDGGVIGI